MEERLLKLLDTEQLSSSKFADVIGVQRSSVSHILTGRNKPSFDFLQKTLKAFPMLNADWLILGEGEMYEGERGPGGGSLFDQPTPVAGQSENGSSGDGVVPSSDASSPGPSGAHISGSSSAEGGNIGEGKEYAGDNQGQDSWNTDSRNPDELHQDVGERQIRGQVNEGPLSRDQAAGQPVRTDETGAPGAERRQSGTSSSSGSKQAAVASSDAQVSTAFSQGMPQSDTKRSPGDTDSQRKVRRVILFYDDNSFEAYEHA